MYYHTSRDTREFDVFTLHNEATIYYTHCLASTATNMWVIQIPSMRLPESSGALLYLFAAAS